jgi:hypothetical protein
MQDPIWKESSFAPSATYVALLFPQPSWSYIHFVGCQALDDRIEYAIRSIGFSRDTASNLSTHQSYQPYVLHCNHAGLKRQGAILRSLISHDIYLVKPTPEYLYRPPPNSSLLTFPHLYSAALQIPVAVCRCVPCLANCTSTPCSACQFYPVLRRQTAMTRAPRHIVAFCRLFP